MVKQISRIKAIQKLVPSSVEMVVDICCDHGQIGEVFIGSKQVTFVDQVPNIMSNLENRLKATYIPSEFRVITSDARQFDYKNNVSTCFVICGIGGDLGIEILKKILPIMKETDSCIIGVHKNTLKLRDFLINKDLKLREEVLVKENGKFYELILIDKTSTRSISNVGSEIWSSFTDIHEEFLLQQIAYFTKKAEYDDSYKLTLGRYLEIAKKNGIFLNK